MTEQPGLLPAAGPRPWVKHYTSGTPDRIAYGTSTLLDQFDNAVETYSDRPATEFFGRITDYAELGRKVRHAAEGLRRLGVGPGDRVAVLLPNCPQAIVVFYATLRLGAVVVEHNPLYTEHELTEPFADHRAKVVVTWNVIAPMVLRLAARRETAVEHVVAVDLLDELPTVKRLALRIPLPPVSRTRARLSVPVRGEGSEQVIDWSGLEKGPELDFSHPRPAHQDVALLLYTSGTTGVPKGAQLTHANLVANSTQGRAWVPELRPGHERFLAALPMFHAYGVTMCVVFGIAQGACLQLVPTPDMSLIMPIMKKNLPTFIPAVPPVYHKILDEAEKRKISLHGVRHSFSGAMSLPASLIERWEAATGGLLVEGYGMTESSPITVGNPMSAERRPGSVGIPFPDTDVRVTDKDDPSVEVPRGEPGELLVRGPQVFPGYLNRPEATEEAFHDGWLRTGDVVVQDEDGFISIVDRIKEMIVTGGFNVYPSEVEEVLREHESVSDCAVVGLRADDGGERVVAAIVPTGGSIDAKALRAHCKANLAGYKVPREFVEIDELPVNQMGKVQRKQVVEQLQDSGGN